VTDTLLLPILGAGFAAAFLHAALPVHWLPFVLVGRAQGWSGGRVLSVAGLAAVAHVAFTALLGAALVTAGMELDRRFEGLLPRLAAGLLFVLAAFYVIRSLRRAPHPHGRLAGEARMRDGAAVAGLVGMLLLSPCVAFLPVYLSGAHLGWGGFALLTAVLFAGIAAGMLLFTRLALAGAERLRLPVLERYESLILGVMLALLGAAILILET
jgi:nickel/cobalt transporter (NicO) family protein